MCFPLPATLAAGKSRNKKSRWAKQPDGMKKSPSGDVPEGACKDCRLSCQLVSKSATWRSETMRTLPSPSLRSARAAADSQNPTSATFSAYGGLSLCRLHILPEMSRTSSFQRPPRGPGTTDFNGFLSMVPRFLHIETRISSHISPLLLIGCGKLNFYKVNAP